MITIECRCTHFRHRQHVAKIMAYVIAGILEPHTWIPCTECDGIAFWIDECGEEDLHLRVVEGGRR